VNKTRRLAKVAVKKSTQALLKLLIIQVSTKNNNHPFGFYKLMLKIHQGVVSTTRPLDWQFKHS